MTVWAMAGVGEMVDSVGVALETIPVRMALGTEVQVGMEVRMGMQVRMGMEVQVGMEVQMGVEVQMGKRAVEEKATTLQVVKIIAAPTRPKILPTINQLSSLLLLPSSWSRLPLLPAQH
jgi:hypothetical protein